MRSIIKLRAFKGLFNLPKRSYSVMKESFYDEEHLAMQDSLKKIIDNDINPYVEEWEKAGEYPAQKIFKQLGGYLFQTSITFFCIFLISEIDFLQKSLINGELFLILVNTVNT